ncbi:hypothetical protein IWW39_003880 [Coemansia spiralis]|uniref:Lysophospholipase n=1 Tax=Coemansia spiralis TaxID=417178 RepID=A0A9W8L465_9FUNG|nr:hypothetical protein IWW39_003880 [Coemansia spiralis]
MLQGEGREGGRNVRRQETSSGQVQALDHSESSRSNVPAMSAEPKPSAFSCNMQSDKHSAAASSPLGKGSASVVSTIESLAIGPSTAQDLGSTSAGNRDAIDPAASSNDASSKSLMPSEVRQLDELTMDDQTKAGDSSEPTEQTTARDSVNSSASTPRKHRFLDKIGAASAKLGQKIEEARATLECAVQGVLPEQFQRPWLSASAQLCLDPETHPELLQHSSQRIGAGLCRQELEFRKRRAEQMREDFAQFIGVAAETVDERDIPVISVAGSGGGFRAMVSTAGSLRAMYDAGLAKCVTYNAAVSGSSWTMGALHTHADGNPHRVLDTLRLSMQSSILSLSSLMFLVSNYADIAQRVFAEIAARYLIFETDEADKTGEADTTNEADKTDKANEAGDTPGDASNPESGKAEPESITREAPSAKLMAFGKIVRRSLKVAKVLFPDYFGNSRNIQANSTVPVPKTTSDFLEVAKKALQSLPLPPLSIVEIYGALLFKQLIVEHSPGDGHLMHLKLDPQWTRLSVQGLAVDQGLHPMPIYTAVRHLICRNNDDNDQSPIKNKYQWFEFSPYEVGSIDHGAWVPTWAIGRPIKDGKELYRVGELHFGSVLGTVSSAFCASIDAMGTDLYLAAPPKIRAEILDPVLNKIERDAEVSHPIPPYTLFNPFYRTDSKQSADEPESKMADLESAQLLSLMDGALENNLPFASLLRPDRDVDVIICLDASASIDITPWFARAEWWANDHGVRRWPWGARPWAADPPRPARIEATMNSKALESTKQAAAECERRMKNDNVRCVVFDKPIAPSPLATEQEGKERPPISILYLPLLSNREFREPEFDPQTADFCETFNLKWKAEQVELLSDLTTFNFNQELEQIRQAVKRAYERKRAYRLDMERQETE